MKNSDMFFCFKFILFPYNTIFVEHDHMLISKKIN